MAAHGKIFVSYRRDDAAGDARSIYERLGRSFGEKKVFMDVDQLLAGQRFDRELDKALAECDVLIAVIGPRWMDLLSEQAKHGKRDYVRDEIAAALQRDIIVIPVMMGRRQICRLYRWRRTFRRISATWCFTRNTTLHTRASAATPLT
jgi:hypothetical protein